MEKRRPPNRSSAWGSLQRALRRELDLWFGTLARYAGLGMLFYGLFVDKGRNPALLTCGTGLVFFKTVVGKD